MGHYVLLIVEGRLWRRKSKKKNQEKRIKSVTEISKEDATKQETSAQISKEEGKLNEEKFKQIKEGMTLEEVFKIVGSKGKVISETGTNGDSNHTVIYEFETAGAFSTANMTFQENKIINKTQIGLN
ncbi:hypothetical protein [Lysinibacillus pakistanensis]|uniref:DUF3862 domain-containing protein n=1 Tax=Lysinibacillus pakistanensis TaxID=759811 RepID=A0ABX6D7X2_9BACI|nr:hypothetical protein GDS87_06845 [Lysinibacillus pakistanensis]